MAIAAPPPRVWSSGGGWDGLEGARLVLGDLAACCGRRGWIVQRSSGGGAVGGGDGVEWTRCYRAWACRSAIRAKQRAYMGLGFGYFSLGLVASAFPR